MEDEGKSVKSRAGPANWRHFLTGGESIALMLFPSELEQLQLLSTPLSFAFVPYRDAITEKSMCSPHRHLLSAGKMVPSSFQVPTFRMLLVVIPQKL